MKSTCYFESKNKNSYLYDKSHKCLINVHPIMNVIMVLDANNDLDINTLKEKAKEFYPELLISELGYYIKKFRFLKRNEFFKKKNPGNLWKGSLTPYLVQRQLANLDNIVFQVTDICNLKCVYCCYGNLYDNGEYIKNISMKFSTAKKIIDYMIPYWNSAMNISKNNVISIGFYGGEPLLNFSLIKKIVTEISRIKLKNNASFVFNMTTNGILLGQCMDFLVENNFNLLISLDGNKKHSSLRVDKHGNASFERVINNIKVLKAKHPKYFRTNVQFNSVLNINSSSEEVYDFIFKNYNKTPLLNLISDKFLKSDMQQEFWKIHQNYYESIEMANNSSTKSPLLKEIAQFFYYQHDNCYKHYYEILVSENNKQKKIPTGTCLPFWKKMYVIPSGEIYACETIGFDHVLGTVKDKVNIDFKKICELYNQSFKAISQQCAVCYDAESCSLCLFQFDFKNGIPKCTRRQDERIFERKMSHRVSVLERNPHWFKIINKLVLG